MRWIKKMNNYFFDGLVELYHHTGFGEDRTTRTGCRCENVVFVFCFCFFGWSRSESGALCCQWVQQVRTSIALPFIVQLWRGLQLFSEGIVLSQALLSSHITRWAAPQFSRNCGLKLRKVQLETKTSSHEGQCIPAGCRVTVPRRVLIIMSVITMRSRLFPANSTSDCLRFTKSRPQFSNLVAPSTDGSAKSLVRYKAHLVL